MAMRMKKILPFLMVVKVAFDRMNSSNVACFAFRDSSRCSVAGVSSDLFYKNLHISPVLVVLLSSTLPSPQY